MTVVEIENRFQEAGERRDELERTILDVKSKHDLLGPISSSLRDAALALSLWHNSRNQWSYLRIAEWDLRMASWYANCAENAVARFGPSVQVIGR